MLHIPLMLASHEAKATAYTWTQLASMPAPPRHRVVALSIGSKGYIGLGHINSNSSVIYADWWEYNPGNNSWTQKADFGGGNRYHATGFVIDHYAYVGTGRDQSFNNTVDFWKYNPWTNQWTQVSDFPGSPRRGAVSFAIGDTAYVGSGSGTSDFYRYIPAYDLWEAISPIPTGGRIASVAFSIGKKGYVGTGLVGNAISNDFWEYNPATDLWTAKASVGFTVRTQAGGFALGGKGYIGTGLLSSIENLRDFYEYDPQNNSWIQIPDFPGAKRRYLGCFTIGNKAYAGTGTNGTNFADLWEFTVDTTVQTTRYISNSQLQVYPNPVHETIAVDLSARMQNREDFYFVLYDMKGHAYALGHASDFPCRFMRKHIPAGAYLLTARTGKGIVMTKKLILL